MHSYCGSGQGKKKQQKNVCIKENNLAFYNYVCEMKAILQWQSSGTCLHCQGGGFGGKQEHTHTRAVVWFIPDVLSLLCIWVLAAERDDEDKLLGFSAILIATLAPAVTCSRLNTSWGKVRVSKVAARWSTGQAEVGRRGWRGGVGCSGCLCGDEMFLVVLLSVSPVRTVLFTKKEEKKGIFYRVCFEIQPLPWNTQQPTV